jgi:two-component system, NtrC family, sensor kinase
MTLSIKVKFTIIAILIGIISYGVAAYLSTRWMAEEIKEDYKEKAGLIGTHIIHDIETSMVTKIHGRIFDVLSIYRKHKDVEEVKIFNSKGREVFVQGQGTTDIKVEEALRTGGPVQVHKRIGQKDVTTFIIPIKFKPECSGCHEKREGLRGALLLSINQAEMEKLIGQQKQRYFILFGLLTLAIIASTFFAVNQIILKPLKRIQKGAEAIERGEFEFRIPVEIKDELGSLAKNFNQMAQGLQDKNERLWEQFRLLSRSYKEWQETFDGIPDLISVIDWDCNIVKANQAFRQYFSIPSSGEVNKKCHEFIGTCLLSNCPQSTCIQQKTPVISEVRDVKTGKVLQISIFPGIPEEKGETSYSIFIARDITEKKESEMQLIMSERLAALGQMASGIAHELNNPLATIAASAEGILKRVEKENIGSLLFRSYLKIIDEEIARCKKITTGMLSFARGTGHGRREVDIHEVLDKTVDIIGFQGRLKEVEVFRNHQREMPKIMGNDGELMQVFLSIITNALDAMEDKGTLTLETRGEGNTLFVRISDTGPGIPSHLTERIFDPFFTTKSENGGTGLGLSIANKIINDHQGKIVVTSAAGKGATFEIVLPAIQ